MRSLTFSAPTATGRRLPRISCCALTKITIVSRNARSATRAFPFRSHKMKCYLSLKRLKGQRSVSVPVEVRKRLVDFRLTRADGYRVARALCCTGGSEVAVLWEPTLIRVSNDSFLFQGFEKADQQTVVQEWVVEPCFSGNADFSRPST